MLALNPSLKVIVHIGYLLAVVFIPVSWGYGQSNTHLEDCDLLPYIDSQLVHFNPDTTLPTLLSAIETHCDSEPNCMIEHYKKLSYKLERKSLLYAAIYVEGEIIKQAKKIDDKKSEAFAYLNLSRFNDAKGFSKLASINLDQAIEASKECDCYQTYIQASFYKFKKLILQGEMEPSDSIFLELLQLAEEKKDTNTILWSRRNLAYYYIQVNEYDNASGQLSILESYLRNGILDSTNYLERMRIPYARGMIALARQNFDDAETYFQESEYLAKQAPDYWIQASSLLHLARITKQQGHYNEYLKHLDQVLEIAIERDLLDILISAYAEKAAYLEETGDYQGAIECLKNSKAYEDDWKSRQSDFDAENLLLLKEKEKLEAEKESQSLALSIEKQQSNLLRWAIVIAVLLLALLGWAYFQRTKGMKKIADQKNTIERQAEKLKTLDQAKSRFFANISHEFRTPLTLIMGPLAQLLKSDNLTQQQKKQLKRVTQNSGKLMDMVNQILDLRKLESGTLSLNPEPTDIGHLFSSLAAQFESLAFQNDVQFTFENQVPPGTRVQLDREVFRQILFNLLSNAIKFTGKGQTVNASIALKNDNIQLEVRDTGRGIHPDDIPHLFNRYFQTKDGTSAAEGGTGIGLSLCHEYAKLMGGDIGVESTQGKGTVFSVWFPVVYANGSMASTTPLPVGLEQELTNTESTVPMQDAKPPRPASRPGSHKLLIVEDSPDLRKYIRELLEEQYEVLEARNGKEALKKLSEHSDIHLILSDLMMPEMDGYELLKRIKEDQELFKLPFIMLTARADSDSRLNALRVGVDDYLTKPFEEAELLARIKNLLKNYQARTKASASTEAATEENAEMISIVDREWLQDFEAYILDHLSSDALSVPELAAHFAMSESTLRRRLQQLTGLSTKQYLQEVRLNRARQLFEMRTHKTVSEVAKEVGYTQLRSFSRIFKERFGKTPSSYLF
ncbi:MAG: hypothetical protein KatS3mg029_0283 [Saprospiraceae bacterium]|nr:MAG: hypothetical protein KatS3mg029_0283 [Saprospiraceae bacterium]